MFLKKIIFDNKLLIFGLIISNCNSSDQNIKLYNTSNNIFSYENLKKFYERKSNEISNDINISEKSKPESKCDLIQQIKNSQNQLMESVCKLVNKINDNQNKTIQLLEKFNTELKQNIMRDINMRYIIALINQFPNEFHENITNPIIKLLNNNTKSIIDNNQHNIINDSDDILCNRLCNKLTDTITQLLQSKKKQGILQNKLRNRRNKKLVICFNNQISILVDKNNIQEKNKEFLISKKYRIKVKRRRKTSNIERENSDILYYNPPRTNSFNTSNTSDSTQEQSQTQSNHITLSKNANEQLSQILQTNNKLYCDINEINLLLELNQCKITEKVNKSNNNLYNILKDHIKQNKQLIINTLNQSKNNTINNVQDKINKIINNNTKLIIESCNNIINKNYETYYDTIKTSKPIISEIIDNKILSTVNNFDTKYNEIIKNYHDNLVQCTKLHNNVFQEVKEELQHINNNITRKINTSTEKVLLSFSAFNTRNNSQHEECEKVKKTIHFFQHKKK